MTTKHNYTCSHCMYPAISAELLLRFLAAEKQEVVVNKPASYGLVGLSALVLVLILVLILVVFFRREIRLFIKDSFWQSPPAGTRRNYWLKY